MFDGNVIGKNQHQHEGNEGNRYDNARKLLEHEIRELEVGNKVRIKF